MDLDDFIKNFASQFEETDVNIFAAQTKFKDLAEWSSFMALSIIAMIDAEYGVKIKGDDIRNSSIIEELYMIVKLRI